MSSARDRSLELFARQAASLFIEAQLPRPNGDEGREAIQRYQRALGRAFREVAEDVDDLEAWTAVRAATRAEALTLSDPSGDLVQPLHARPTPLVLKLARAIEQVVGTDVGVLRAYGRTAPLEPPPLSATFVTEPSAAFPSPENPMTALAATSRTDLALTDRLAAEAHDAAWLIFAGKSVEIAQQSVGAFLQRHLAEADPALRGRIGVLMQTQLGGVITALVLSAAAQTFGSTVADKVGVSAARLDVLASKLRIHAMASGGRALVDELIGPFVSQLTELIRAMPSEEPALLAEKRTVDEAQPQRTRATAA